MKPGCAAILAIQLRTAVLGVRSMPASDATCVYANNEMSAMESESPTRKLRPVSVISSKSRPFSPVLSPRCDQLGVASCQHEESGSTNTSDDRLLLEVQPLDHPGPVEGPPGKYSLPSPKYQRTAFDCTITSPPSSSRIGV